MIVVAFTAYNRLDYFRQTLSSWARVRRIKTNVRFIFNIEPSDVQDQMVWNAQNFLGMTGFDGEVLVNHKKYGVLGNPHMAFTRAFADYGTAYAILGEDDLLVSNDFLEFHEWAAGTYQDDPEIGAVCPFTYAIPDGTEKMETVRRVPSFGAVSCWGTWRDRWYDYYADTWDFDYSSGPDFKSGWDWNLALRVFPENGLKSIQPDISRVQNNGFYGTHTYGQQIVQAIGFTFHHPVVQYKELPIKEVS